nr:hypothetical protein CFP56_37480 [Quercus suber]
MYLDHHFVGRRSIPSLNDLAILCFHDLIVKWKLMGETPQVLIEKEKTKHRDTVTYQESLSKYADMRLEEGSSVSLSKQWPMQIVKAHLFSLRDGVRLRNQLAFIWSTVKTLCCLYPSYQALGEAFQHLILRFVEEKLQLQENSQVIVIKFPTSFLLGHYQFTR